MCHGCIFKTSDQTNTKQISAETTRCSFFGAATPAAAAAASATAADDWPSQRAVELPRSAAGRFTEAQLDPHARMATIPRARRKLSLQGGPLSSPPTRFASAQTEPVRA
eukprot:CAMPEP_0204116588 /NCGR_PEP_ID=MMETSP0361-20130328/5502_1 /ASSEMBLY_ACC=CAM_ASM_000343 /TAXON_ID=268821 /ORGANISM="Scrippsiella Hangoei, Strain SHTV-5" /LENGTH=108 /DNA_ID=CAMNT_0051067409 /DNA_START=230 /DNA_END=559 /DNA_ORIENTATION=-